MFIVVTLHKDSCNPVTGHPHMCLGRCSKHHKCKVNGSGKCECQAHQNVDLFTTTKQAVHVKNMSTKLSIVLAFESLCPGCSDVLSGPIADALKKPGFLDMVDLQLLPYGNAKVEDGKIVCQHGPSECYGNKVEACGLKHASSVLSGDQFVTCVESDKKRSSTKDFDSLLTKCAAKVGLDAKSIQTCVSGTEGDDLINQIAKQTPAHHYVPYVVANGKHTTKDEDAIEDDA